MTLLEDVWWTLRFQNSMPGFVIRSVCRSGCNSVTFPAPRLPCLLSVLPAMIVNTLLELQATPQLYASSHKNVLGHGNSFTATEQWLRPSWCCDPLIQLFFMLWWPPIIKLSLLLVCNCSFASVMKHNINVWCAGSDMPPRWKSHLIPKRSRPTW